MLIGFILSIMFTEVFLVHNKVAGLVNVVEPEDNADEDDLGSGKFRSLLF